MNLFLLCPAQPQDAASCYPLRWDLGKLPLIPIVDDGLKSS
jgi:hypothetical protein